MNKDYVTKQQVKDLLRLHCLDWVKQWKTSLGDSAGSGIDFNKACAAIDDLPDPHVVTRADKSRCKRDEGSTKEPQSSVEDDLLKAVHKYYGQWPSPRLLRLVQAIAAKIEGVRKEVRNNWDFTEERLDNQVSRIRDCEHKVSDIPALWENDEQKGRKITDLERKVKAVDNCLKKFLGQFTDLSSEYKNHLIDEHDIRITVKPQPSAESPEQSQRVARCKDEKGKEHDLIPRVSVVETPNIEMLFLYKNRYGNFVGYTSKQPQAEYKKPRRSEDGTWVAAPGDVTWVFDLPSCGDEGTFPGGDK